MNSFGADDRSLRAQLASRARELGGGPRPEDLVLEWMAEHAAAGARLVRARWDAPDGEHGLSGLQLAGELDTYPLQAIGKLFDLWLASSADSPLAARAAKACAFLLDPLGRRQPILARPDLDALPASAPNRSAARLPVFDTAAAGPQLTFWWFGPRGGSEVHVRRDADRRIVVRESPPADRAVRGNT